MSSRCVQSRATTSSSFVVARSGRVSPSAGPDRPGKHVSSPSRTCGGYERRSWAASRLGRHGLLRSVRGSRSGSGRARRCNSTMCGSRRDSRIEPASSSSPPACLATCHSVGRRSSSTGAAYALEVDGGAVRGCVRVDDVACWWPASHGAQPLYGVDVRFERDAGTVTIPLGRVGFRAIDFGADEAPALDGQRCRRVLPRGVLDATRSGRRRVLIPRRCARRSSRSVTRA